MELTLSPRLLAVANKVVQGARLADVGTDHAYIPIYLALKGKIDFAYACDINEGPVTRAALNIKKYGMENCIRPVLSDGLKSIPPDYDTLVIAGMGGMLILDILEHLTGDKRIIIQPMTAIYELRCLLCERGFDIINEELAQEGDKLYVIMELAKGQMEKCSEAEMRIGKKLIENNDPLLPLWLDKHILKMQKIVDGLKIAKNKQDIDKYEFLLSEYKRFRGNLNGFGR